MTTILTLEPLGGPLMGGTMHLNFGGAGLVNGFTTRPWLGCTTGTRVINVRYPASMSCYSIPDGVVAFDRAARAITTGNILAVAHSQGAQVFSRWLRTLSQEPGAPSTSRLSAILFGNPLRKFGGFGVGTKEFDGVVGQSTPTDSGYSIIDYKLQYDGWADNPSLSGVWAFANANADRYGINGNRAIHAMGYRTASLAAPGIKTFTENTTTFVMAPHAPLLRVPRSWIERSYRRPEH